MFFEIFFELLLVALSISYEFGNRLQIFVVPVTQFSVVDGLGRFIAIILKKLVLDFLVDLVNVKLADFVQIGKLAQFIVVEKLELHLSFGHLAGLCFPECVLDRALVGLEGDKRKMGLELGLRPGGVSLGHGVLRQVHEF